MASNSFRDSLNSMGWSRRDPDIPVNTAATPIMSRLQSLNPFRNEGYVRLPTQEQPGAPLPAPTRREEEEGFFARKSASPDRNAAGDKDQVPAHPSSSPALACIPAHLHSLLLVQIVG